MLGPVPAEFLQPADHWDILVTAATQTLKEACGFRTLAQHKVILVSTSRLTADDRMRLVRHRGWACGLWTPDANAAWHHHLTSFTKRVRLKFILCFEQKWQTMDVVSLAVRSAFLNLKTRAVWLECGLDEVLGFCGVLALTPWDLFCVFLRFCFWGRAAYEEPGVFFSARGPHGIWKPARHFRELVRRSGSPGGPSVSKGTCKFPSSLSPPHSSSFFSFSWQTCISLNSVCPHNCFLSLFTFWVGFQI